MGAELIPLAFTTGWGSGINAYAVVLVLGLADRIFGLGQIPDALARTDVLVGAGILFAVEMLADKIPYVDSVWDSVHTVVRPTVGATIGYLIGHETASLDAAIGAATGGVTALVSHGIKAGLRAAVNTSPEPASNVVVSTTEDVAVTGITALAIAHPWWAASIALVLLAAGAFLVYKLAARIRGYKRRYDAWGERVGIAAPRTRRRPPAPESPPPRPRTQVETPVEARVERSARPFDQET
ncbi:DUF4126 domain-containing protein [Terrabacter sp. BE26]|uniref:DUF4126 domain-containing protein n=1 Tax=Terrabacter sp. BE26 TaxID=2898152 RepID=UPI0035BE3A46